MIHFLKKLFHKYKEIITYVFFGVLSTIVSWGSYIIFIKLFNSADLASKDARVFTANCLSWLCAVIFAFVTNKLWVFESKSWKPDIFLKELTSFFSSRIVTGIVEIIGVPVLSKLGTDDVCFAVLKRTPLKSVDFLFSDGFYSKILISVVVIILNYIFSKLFVFKNDDDKNITVGDCFTAMAAFVRKHKTAFAFIGAFITTGAFYLNLGISTLPKDVSQYKLFSIPLYRMIIHFIYAVKDFNVYAVFIFVAIFYFYNKREYFKAKRGEKIALFVFSQFAVFMLMLCDSYRAVSSWDLVFGGECAVAVAVAKIFGMGILLYTVLAYILNYINSPKFSLTTNGLAKKNYKKDFFVYLLIILICWLPYIILLYPGTITHDAIDEIAQIYGNKSMCWTQDTIVLINPDMIINNHHPVFYTEILGLFCKLGKAIGSYETAFYIYTVLQCIFLAGVLAYTIVFTKKRKAKKGFIVFEILFFALNPLLADFACTIVKDVPFTAVTLLAMLSLYEVLDSAKSKPSSYILLFVECMLMMLLRNNGIYILAILIVVAVIVLAKSDKKKFAKMASTVVVAVLVFQIGFINIICPHFQITPGSRRELLSVPFQQTARYVKEYPDDVSKEDEEAILDVLSFDSLEDMAKAYDPTVADSVKNEYNKYSTNEDLANYFKVWFKQLKTHPDSYFEAYLNLHYSWFSFNSVDTFTVYSSQKRGQLRLDKVLPKWNTKAGVASGRRLVSTVTEAFKSNPVSDVFVEMGSYTWLYLFMLIYGIAKRKKKSLVVNTVMFANYLICFVSPVAYTRYALPMIAASVFSLFITMTEESSPKRNKKKLKKENK